MIYIDRNLGLRDVNWSVRDQLLGPSPSKPPICFYHDYL